MSEVTSHPTHSGHYSDVKTLLSWHAPGRPFQKKGKEFYATVLLLGLLIEIILFLFSEYVLMMAVASLIFLSFALSSVPPKDFHYKITSEGIQIEDFFYIWEELYDFYFKKIDGQDTLFVRTHAPLPGELKIPVGEHSLQHIRMTILPYLPFREVVHETFMEKSATWLSHNFPLERHPKG
jgi:hypothetical protein